MQCRSAKSFVDDLGLCRGVVPIRAAASLRFIETKPYDREICPPETDTISHWLSEHSFARSAGRSVGRLVGRSVGRSTGVAAGGGVGYGDRSIDRPTD